MTWYQKDQHGTPPAPFLYERAPTQKPLLYDHRGTPLVKTQRPVGFQPPKERKEQP